jgi:excisionase family DNA binding protein
VPDERDNAKRVVGGGLLTVRQAARFLNISIAKTYALMADGELPFTRIGRCRRVPKRGVIALAAKNLTAGAD